MHRVTSQKICVFDIAAVGTTCEEIHFRWNRPSACLVSDDVSIPDMSLWVQTLDIRPTKAPFLLERTYRNFKTAFCVITRKVVVIPYRRFGLTYRSNFQGSRIKNVGSRCVTTQKSAVLICFAAEA